MAGNKTIKTKFLGRSKALVGRHGCLGWGLSATGSDLTTGAALATGGLGRLGRGVAGFGGNRTEREDGAPELPDEVGAGCEGRCCVDFSPDGDIRSQSCRRVGGRS